VPIQPGPLTLTIRNGMATGGESGPPELAVPLEQKRPRLSPTCLSTNSRGLLTRVPQEPTSLHAFSHHSKVHS
jgi:hypothetical protein